MKIQSPSFQDQGEIPKKYTCDGENISPPLNFVDVPQDGSVQSLVLIVDDPDASSGDFVHWLVFDIPANAVEVTEGRPPYNGIVGLNDFGRNDWGGPCPPSGRHRYQFTLYALNQVLNLPPTAKKSDLLPLIEANLIDQTKLTASYSREF